MILMIMLQLKNNFMMMRKRPPTSTSVEVEASIQMTFPPPDQIQKDQTRLVASKKMTKSESSCLILHPLLSKFLHVLILDLIQVLLLLRQSQLSFPNQKRRTN